MYSNTIEHTRSTSWPCFEDREIGALWVGGFFLLAVPILILFGSLLIAAWMSVFGGYLGYHGSLHELFFGYLSTRQKIKQGKNNYYIAWGINNRPWIYLLMVINAYIVYQVCELFAYGFRLFKRALS